MTEFIIWVIGLPATLLAIVYAIVIAELLAAKRRMRLHLIAADGAPAGGKKAMQKTS